MELSKLEKVDLRKVWKHEAFDFTNWLAQSENLSLLSEEINIEISLIQTEASVGKFNVDILAEEETTARKIVIENQLEFTDHDHLGKIITYASGLDAEIVIWIVREVRDEHKQAIDWLNEHTDEKLNFFVVKMEVWQIGNSPYAPRFHIISQPNDWAKVVKHSAGQSTRLTDLRLLKLDFWEKFRDFAQNSGSQIRLRKPRPQHWYDISFGSSDAHVALTVNSQRNQIGCEVYIPNSKELFHRLKFKKEEIESEFGEILDWQLLPEKKACRIRLVTNGIITESDCWDEYFDWLIRHTEKFQNIFPKYISELTKLA